MGTMTDYKPSDEVAALFARHKRQKAALDRLAELVKAQAVEEMRDRKASTADMADLTGLSDETFRRLARKNEVERLRPPTVGYAVEARRAES